MSRCVGLGGECKNNGQFDRLCYFCHVDARQGNGCVGLCEAPGCEPGRCDRTAHGRSSYHLCSKHMSVAIERAPRKFCPACSFDHKPGGPCGEIIGPLDE